MNVDIPALRASAIRLRADGRPLALWLGASQLYAINHPREGDLTAIARAQHAAAAVRDRPVSIGIANR